MTRRQHLLSEFHRVYVEWMHTNAIFVWFLYQGSDTMTTENEFEQHGCSGVSVSSCNKSTEIMRVKKRNEDKYGKKKV